MIFGEKPTFLKGADFDLKCCCALLVSAVLADQDRAEVVLSGGQGKHFKSL